MTYAQVVILWVLVYQLMQLRVQSRGNLEGM